MVSEWGLCQRVSLPRWQLPWKFGGDGLTPSGATLGIFAHNSRIWHKKRDLAHFTHWCIAPHSWMVSECGLCLKVPPLPWQLPWEFGGDGPTPSMATWCLPKKWDLAQKTALAHFTHCWPSNIQQWGYQHLPYEADAAISKNVDELN